VKGEKIMCDSCEALTINGVYCHESGCPRAWEDTDVQCFECGIPFTPKVKHQHTCDGCIMAELGLWDDYEAERLGEGDD
jgi:hypothetical protein